MTFDAKDHIIVMERKSKKKDAQGHETWEVTKTEYLPVQWRLYWFRCENQKGKIDSKLLNIDLERGAAIFETYVEREDGGSARMHGSETQGDWKDYIEKAQTKSLGRALAAVGYGSQFTDDEFVEGERIVDAPVPQPAQNAPANTKPTTRGNLSMVPQNGTEPSPLLGALQEMYIYARDLQLVKSTVDWEALKVDILGKAVHDEEMQAGDVEKMRKGLAERKKKVANKK
jgi:hypothetical protein